MNFTMGIDIGTFESKGMIVDQNGRARAAASVPHEMLVPCPGWAEHRPDEDWWGDVVKISRELIEKSGVHPKEILAVAVSAIGPCMLPLDKSGKPLMNGVLYGVDTRASAEIELLTERIGAERNLEATGNALTSQSVGPKILWMRRNRPRLFERTDKVVGSASYIVFRLTGEIVIDHHTASQFGPLYDVSSQDWSAELSSGIISSDRLPRLGWSTEIAGEVNDAAARETGLLVGTPVTVGTIDAVAEAVSVGVRSPGDMMMMYGSTIFITQLTERRVQDPRLWYAPWIQKGMHASMAGLATSGTLTHWFQENLSKDLPRETAFAQLAAEAAASPPGARGLIFLPYFSGERTPIHDPLAKGCLFGLNLTHARGDIYRALLEGIANATAHAIDAIREAGHGPQRVLAVGGGVKNSIWLQATSDICDMRQHVAEKTFGASYGNAFLAACAAGSAEMDDVERWNPVVQTVEPNPQDVHRRQYRLFRDLYEKTRDIAVSLSENA